MLPELDADAPPCTHDGNGDERADDPSERAAGGQRQQHGDRVQLEGLAIDERSEQVVVELLDGDHDGQHHQRVTGSTDGRGHQRRERARGHGTHDREERRDEGQDTDGDRKRSADELHRRADDQPFDHPEDRCTAQEPAERSPHLGADGRREDPVTIRHRTHDCGLEPPSVLQEEERQHDPHGDLAGGANARHQHVRRGHEHVVDPADRILGVLPDLLPIQARQAIDRPVLDVTQRRCRMLGGAAGLPGLVVEAPPAQATPVKSRRPPPAVSRSSDVWPADCVHGRHLPVPSARRSWRRPRRLF